MTFADYDPGAFFDEMFEQKGVARPDARTLVDLVGADASHAWLSVYCPGAGWIDLDPTNNVVPGEMHITLARGRDYGDVSPLRGVMLGGGEHQLSVAVDVLRLDA